MELAELKQKIKEFDKKAGFDKTEFSKLISLLEEELSILKLNEANKKIVNHKLVDLLILIMQIAHRHNTNFDAEITKWFNKSKKYLK